MQENLKPCPFCGSQIVGDTGLWRHVITCHNCGAKSKPCRKWNDAVESWNSRTLSATQTYADEMFTILRDLRN